VVALDEGLAGDAGEAVLGEARVEDGIRDAVGDLVGVAFADRLGGEGVGYGTGHKTPDAKGKPGLSKHASKYLDGKMCH
jgi:hypothetical protein